MKETIIITNTLETGTSFGVVASTGEGVFIPASLARQFDLELSDEYEAVLTPNAETKRNNTPWRAVKMTGALVHTEDALEDDWDDQDVLDILSDHDKSLLAHDVTVDLFGRAKGQDVRHVTSVLEDLAKRGRIVKAIIRFGQLTEVRYSADITAFR